MLKQLFVHTATPREALAPRTTIGPAIGARGCPSEVGAAALDREFLVGIDGHCPHGIGDSTALALIRGATAGWRARAHDSRRIHGSSDHIDITEQPARLQLDDRSLLAESIAARVTSQPVRLATPRSPSPSMEVLVLFRASLRITLILGKFNLHAQKFS